jgi:hypothetical protein
MAGALKALGIKLEENWEEGVMVVHGCGGRFPVEVGLSVLCLWSETMCEKREGTGHGGAWL